MKAVFVLVLLATVVLADQKFDRFLSKYGKHYEGAEYMHRLKVYKSNMRKAAQLNQVNNVHGSGANVSHAYCGAPTCVELLKQSLTPSCNT